jgi:hypothetical protein
MGHKVLLRFYALNLTVNYLNHLRSALGLKKSRQVTVMFNQLIPAGIGESRYLLSKWVMVELSAHTTAKFLDVCIGLVELGRILCKKANITGLHRKSNIRD